MKKVVRLTESDLIRLVKRVIKESEEEELNTQLKDFVKQYPERSDFEDYASYKEALEDWAATSGYNDHLDKMGDFLSKKNKSVRSIENSKDDERHSNIVKSRPANFDIDALNAEYHELDADYENDVKDWKSKYSSNDPDFYDKFDERFAPIKAKQDIKFDIRRQLSRDFKPKRGY